MSKIFTRGTMYLRQVNDLGNCWIGFFYSVLMLAKMMTVHVAWNC